MWAEHPAAPSGRRPTELEDVSTVVCGRSRSCHPKGMETVPLARLWLRVLPLDSVSSSPCSSDFLSAMLARNRSVTESHSSGSSRSRNPRQMMQVAASRTTLKITSCFSTSTATERQEETQTLGLIRESAINLSTLRPRGWAAYNQLFILTASVMRSSRTSCNPLTLHSSPKERTLQAFMSPWQPDPPLEG